MKLWTPFPATRQRHGGGHSIQGVEMRGSGIQGHTWLLKKLKAKLGIGGARL